jgi:predicted metalloprotease with PDZ domain
VTFEEVASGTRITIVRSGFGDSEDWRHFAENTERGGDEAIADLILYLETGVRASRHFPFRSGLGATMLQSGGGVRITHVVPGGFAAGAGMQSGDLLLRLNGVPVVRTSDVAFFGREHAPGEVIEAEYVRGSDVLRGSGALSAWSHGTGEYVGHPGGYPKPSLTNA